MKNEKTFEVHEFPEKFHNEIDEHIQHCGGHCHWYPGDGYFKPLSEVRDMTKIHYQNGENAQTKDVYVYEEGDDPIGDWLMREHDIKLIEKVLIIN